MWRNLKISIAILISIAVFTACNHDADTTFSKTIVSGNTVTIRLKETLQDKTGYVRLRMDAVSDSRCPINAICVWAGNGAVTFTLFVNGNPSILTLNTTLGPKVISSQGYKVTLLELLPYPGSENYNNENYYASVRVEKE
ncbi:hypothetical protein [Paludibacter sp.]|uniref:hypothetical protein n=1 Tax=Paludibacter sp. TaxID=1898105 RepID=UPI0013540019|nr:hypothetical protein [Paludibacter sp.]MTK53487.1 hypothetical protein [Paludibacter sp.]